VGSSCTLDARHNRQSTGNNGCDQRWSTQICACRAPEAQNCREPIESVSDYAYFKTDIIEGHDPTASGDVRLSLKLQSRPASPVTMSLMALQVYGFADARLSACDITIQPDDWNSDTNYVWMSPGQSFSPHSRYNVVATLDDGSAAQATVELKSHGGAFMCNAWGDPHYTTWDGRKFDFYGVGDYYMIRSPNLVVQTRQVQCGRASCNTAVAISYKGEGIAVIKKKVNGVDVLKVVRTDGQTGATVSMRVFAQGSTGYIINLDDGGEIMVSGKKMRALHFNAKLSYHFAKYSVSGLCGDWYNSGDVRATRGNGPDYLVPPGESLLNGGTVPALQFEQLVGDTVFLSAPTPPNHVCGCKDEPEQAPAPGDETVPEPPATAIEQPPVPEPGFEPSYEHEFETPQEEAAANTQCHALLDDSLLAQACARVGVDTDEYVQLCIQDASAIGLEEALADSAAALVDECGVKAEEHDQPTVQVGDQVVDIAAQSSCTSNAESCEVLVEPPVVIDDDGAGSSACGTYALSIQGEGEGEGEVVYRCQRGLCYEHTGEGRFSHASEYDIHTVPGQRYSHPGVYGSFRITDDGLWHNSETGGGKTFHPWCCDCE